MKKEYIIISESLLQSWLKDVVTFGLMFLMFYLNHQFTDGAWFIDLAVVIFIVLFGSGTVRRKSYSIDGAIKYLEELKLKA